MSNGASLRERAAVALMDTYARQPLTIVSGRGARVVDDAGRELIDLVAGIAVNVLGHAHPALVRTLASQAERVVHTSNLYLTEPQVALAERLRDSAFPSRVFFCNSGSEANDGAIKLARKWGRINRGGANVIIAMEGAFHGRTLGALAATASARYREPFEPLPGGFVRVPFNEVEAIERAADASTCAVMLEPVQGESGVHSLDPGVLGAVRRLCDDRNLLLILDEVQSGMGRTGAWWAHQHDAVRPDVMTVAKGLGGGVPIGAIVAGARADVFTPGDHGSTFGGGPLACAAGIAVMDTIERDGLLENATAVGALLRERIAALASEGAPVEGVRGRGLMIGVALGAPVAAEVAHAALDAGVIVNAVGEHTLRLVPPLVLTRAEAEESVRRLGLAFAGAQARVPA